MPNNSNPSNLSKIIPHPFIFTPSKSLKINTLTNPTFVVTKYQKCPLNSIVTIQTSQIMNLTTRKLIPPLISILTLISLLRLLKLTVTSPSFSSPKCIQSFTNPNTMLSEKETRFLFNIISQKTPCNVLVFGLKEQYLKLQMVNGGGNTVFLDDKPEKIVNGTQVFRVEYNSYAKDAYKLLKRARSGSGCDLRSGLRSVVLKCKLGLGGLPEEVMETKWDVIVVDGPGGDGPESPGRMGSIFMAGVLARTGNGTNVVVHDVDRMIEKWFSWEFLCEENLVSSKGRFWNFRISKQTKTNSRTFCPA